MTGFQFYTLKDIELDVNIRRFFSCLFPQHNDCNDIAYGKINSIVVRVTGPEDLILWSGFPYGLFGFWLNCLPLFYERLCEEDIS
jgi:hypothetical protein